TSPHMDRNSTGEVREIKRFLAVTAVSGSNELKENFVLSDRKSRSLAEHPAVRREVACKHSDFTDIWCHFVPPLVLRRKDALQRNNEVQHQVRHHVVVGLAAAHACYR